MKKALMLLVICWPYANSVAQFTRQEYLKEYVKVATLELKVVKISASLLLAPEIGWSNPTRRFITPVVMVPAVGFTLTKTIELRLCKLFKMAPGGFIRNYTPRMIFELQTKKKTH